MTLNDAYGLYLLDALHTIEYHLSVIASGRRSMDGADNNIQAFDEAFGVKTSASTPVYQDLPQLEQMISKAMHMIDAINLDDLDSDMEDSITEKLPLIRRARVVVTSMQR